MMKLIGLVILASYHHLSSKFLHKIAVKQENTMGRTSSKNRSMFDGIAHHFLESITPVIRALDTKPASRDHAAADTGSAARSTMDTAIRIEIGQILSFYDRQLNGPIITKKGTYPCTNELLIQNEKRLAEIAEEMNNPNLTITGQLKLQEDMEKNLDWLAVNEARRDHYTNMLQAFSTVYREITNEDWKPVRQEVPGVHKPLENVSESEAAKLKEEALARLERFKKKAA